MRFFIYVAAACSHWAYLAFATHKSSSDDQLDRVAKWCLHADASQDSVSLFAQLNILLLTPEMKPPEMFIFLSWRWEEANVGDACSLTGS